MSSPIIVADAKGNGAPPPSPVVDGSWLADVRAAAAAQQRRSTFEVPVGGEFGNRLMLRYHPAGIDDGARYAGLIDTAGPIDTNIDIMVDCCEAVLYVKDGVPHVMDDARGPVTLDQRLWELMGWELPPGGAVAPHQVVRKLFGDNLMLLGAHIATVGERMSADGATPGESSASSA